LHKEPALRAGFLLRVKKLPALQSACVFTKQ
jgi:hypothetical protein